MATGGRRRDARRGPLPASPGRRLTSGREKRGSPSGAVWNGTFARVNNVPEEHAPARLWSSRSSVQPPSPLQTLLRPLRRPRRWSDARSALEYQDAGTLVRIQRLHNELRVKLENHRGIPKHDRKRSDGNRSEPESEPIKVEAPATDCDAGGQGNLWARRLTPEARASRAAPERGARGPHATRDELLLSTKALSDLRPERCVACPRVFAKYPIPRSPARSVIRVSLTSAFPGAGSWALARDLAGTPAPSRVARSRTPHVRAFRRSSRLARDPRRSAFALPPPRPREPP